jgi:hypothetical protein
MMVVVAAKELDATSIANNMAIKANQRGEDFFKNFENNMMSPLGKNVNLKMTLACSCFYWATIRVIRFGITPIRSHFGHNHGAQTRDMSLKNHDAMSLPDLHRIANGRRKCA